MPACLRVCVSVSVCVHVCMYIIHGDYRVRVDFGATSSAGNRSPKIAGKCVIAPRRRRRRVYERIIITCAVRVCV